MGAMYSFKNRSAELKQIFESVPSGQETYRKIMEIGKNLSPLENDKKCESNRVQGCQSITYLASEFENGSVEFRADSDALISKGIIALLIHLYSGLTPEEILKNPPQILQEMGILSSISITRANGLASMYLKMKQEALKFYQAHSL